MSRLRFAGFVSGLVAIASLSLPLHAAAAPTGITISPALAQITTTAGQASTTFSITAINNTTAPAVLYLTTNDFTSLNNAGSVSFYGQGYNPATNTHALAANIHSGLAQFALAPGESKSVPVTISDLNGLAVGGHYGALVYFVKYPTPGAAGQAHISNNQVLSTLIFLNTSGQGTQSLQLSQPLLGRFYLHWPTDTQFVLTDTGNTQTTPRGTVTLQTQGGNELAKGLINIDSGLILPAGQRLMSVSLANEHKPLLLGHDKIVISYHSDGLNNVGTLVKTFWYFNLPLLALTLLAVVVLVLLLVRLRIYWALRRARARAKTYDSIAQPKAGSQITSPTTESSRIIVTEAQSEATVEPVEEPLTEPAARTDTTLLTGLSDNDSKSDGVIKTVTTIETSIEVVPDTEVLNEIVPDELAANQVNQESVIAELTTPAALPAIVASELQPAPEKPSIPNQPTKIAITFNDQELEPAIVKSEPRTITKKKALSKKKSALSQSSKTTKAKPIKKTTKRATKRPPEP